MRMTHCMPLEDVVVGLKYGRNGATMPWLVGNISKRLADARRKVSSLERLGLAECRHGWQARMRLRAARLADPFEARVRLCIRADGFDLLEHLLADEVHDVPVLVLL